MENCINLNNLTISWYYYRFFLHCAFFSFKWQSFSKKKTAELCVNFKIYSIDFAQLHAAHQNKKPTRSDAYSIKSTSIADWICKRSSSAKRQSVLCVVLIYFSFATHWQQENLISRFWANVEQTCYVFTDINTHIRAITFSSYKRISPLQVFVIFFKRFLPFAFNPLCYL